MPNRAKYGRLLINAEINPCVKSACITLDANHLGRVVKIQIRGHEQQRLMGVLDRGKGEGVVGLFHGRLEQIIDQAAKNTGMAKTQ